LISEESDSRREFDLNDLEPGCHTKVVSLPRRSARKVEKGGDQGVREKEGRRRVEHDEKKRVSRQHGKTSPSIESWETWDALAREFNGRKKD